MMITHLDELVRGLLVLLGHGGRRGLGEHAHGSEEPQRDTETNGDVESDLAALIGGSLSTGAVGTESDPVCCRERKVSCQ